MHRTVADRDLDETPFSGDEARTMFRDMVRARRFDERCVALQRRGWMSGYPPFAGQEASQVGAAHAMDDADRLFPTYRSNAMALTLGVPMADVLRFRRGRPEFGSGADVPVFTQAVPIATQIPHAVGAAMATDYRRGRLAPEGGRDRPGATDGGEAPSGDDAGGTAGADRPGEFDGDLEDPGTGDARPATVCYMGDGATSEGDFHEGLNFAGVFEAPVLFFCENNNWAISTPRRRQTASDTLAGKAEAYGFSGGQVDGMDPLAVREMVGAALREVRAGGPAMVESLTYRRGAHTTSDDPGRYRDREGELPDWRTADPVDRFESYLRDQGVLDGEDRAAFAAAADDEVDEAVETVEADPDPDPGEMFDAVYATPTPRLERQRAAVRSRIDGDDRED